MFRGSLDSEEKLLNADFEMKGQSEDVVEVFGGREGTVNPSMKDRNRDLALFGKLGDGFVVRRESTF